MSMLDTIGCVILQAIIRSFRTASQLAVEKVRDLSIDISGTSEEEKKDMLRKCAMTSLSSKLVRAHHSCEFNLMSACAHACVSPAQRTTRM